MLKPTQNSLRTRHGVVFVVAMLACAFCAAGVCAQEDSISAPPPLQWPTAVSANPTGRVPFLYSATAGLRYSVEQAADAELCKMLMKDANATIPNEMSFTYDDCPAGYKSMISLRQGKYSWADGARPTECGRNCIGAPFTSQTQNMSRPNARYALVYGNLTFQVNTVGPLSRNITYFLEIDATCDVSAGSKTGTANLTTHVEGPVADDPSFLESVINFLILPVEFSQYINNYVSKSYGNSTSSQPNQGPCSSMGAYAADPASYKYDEFTWDIPHPTGANRGLITAPSAIKRSATLYFDRVVRNHTIESNPSTAPSSFTLYINGVPAHIPPNGSVTLSPNGASSDQKYCRTISMEDVDALQILFVDNLGGAVWSQFGSAQNFGSGGSHKMTTGRTFLRPGLHPGDKPISYVAREFELDYRVDYRGTPTSVVAPTPIPTGGRRGVGPPNVVGANDQPQGSATCTKF